MIAGAIKVGLLVKHIGEAVVVVGPDVFDLIGVLAGPNDVILVFPGLA